MFKIRAAQWEPFRSDAVLDFERRMVEHVREFFPEDCARMGEADVREWIRHGIERANHYGIRTERGTCSYVDVMFGYGRDFDRDPALPWAASILADHGENDGEEHAERLFDAAFPISEGDEQEDATPEDEDDHEHEADDEDDEDDADDDGDEDDGPESEEQIDEAAVREELEGWFHKLDEVVGDE